MWCLILEYALQHLSPYGCQIGSIDGEIQNALVEFFHLDPWDSPFLVRLFSSSVRILQVMSLLSLKREKRGNLFNLLILMLSFYLYYTSIYFTSMKFSTVLIVPSFLLDIYQSYICMQCTLFLPDCFKLLVLTGTFLSIFFLLIHVGTGLYLKQTWSADQWWQ